MKNNFRFPPQILHILEVFEQSGHSAYAVGGCVRDALRGVVPSDYDLCTSALPEETIALFEKAIPTGMAHGTITVFYDGVSAEVTTLRREGTYADHRRPDQVFFTTDLSEDLARRDFTINAMAMDRDYTLYDPFGGQADLDTQVIRCVGQPQKRFQEDALRMFRAFRFAAQLGFTMEENTYAAIAQQAEYGKYVAAERIRVELEKMLLSDRAHELEQVFALGLLCAYAIPENTPALNMLDALPKEADLRYTALTYALYRSHAIPCPQSFMKQLRMDNLTTKRVVNGIEIAENGFPQDTISIKRCLSKYGSEALYCAAACTHFTEGKAAIDAVIALHEPYTLRELCISGKEVKALGLSGIATGKVLACLLDAVICNPKLNSPEQLLALAKKEAECL